MVDDPETSPHARLFAVMRHQCDVVVEPPARRAPTRPKRRPESSVEDASLFILKRLETGPVTQLNCQNAAMDAGFRESTFRKALFRLIRDESRVQREGMGGLVSPWILSLVNPSIRPNQGA